MTERFDDHLLRAPLPTVRDTDKLPVGFCNLLHLATPSVRSDKTIQFLTVAIQAPSTKIFTQHLPSLESCSDVRSVPSVRETCHRLTYPPSSPPCNATNPWLLRFISTFIATTPVSICRYPSSPQGRAPLAGTQDFVIVRIETSNKGCRFATSGGRH